MKPDITHSEIFSIRSIITHILIYLLSIFILYGIIFHTIISFNKSMWNNINSNKVIASYEILDLCNVLHCRVIAIQNNESIDIYKVDDNNNAQFEKTIKDVSKIKYTIPYSKFIPNSFIAFKSVKGDNIFLENGIYNRMIITTFILISIFLTIPSLFIYIYIMVKFNIRSRLNKGLYKSELETRLKRDLTEVLCHELGVPISIIETHIDELIYRFYPCNNDKCKTCVIITPNGNNEITNCTGCQFNQQLSDFDKENIIIIKDLLFAVDRIKSILKIISNSKRIRFSNGTVPIYAICENIVSSINSFKLRKISAEYVNVDVIKKYSVKANLGNGNLLNILHVLLNNAIEAGADKVIIESNLIDDTRMSMKVKDNGTGIRNSNNKCVLDNKIFTYGYTTKDENNNRYNCKSLLNRILDLLGFNLIHKKSTRGIGLYISKSILEKNGGDIRLIDTTPYGTTFELIIPIKKTKF